MAYNEYIISEADLKSDEYHPFSDISVLAQGSQSKVYDLSKFVLKIMTREECPSMRILQRLRSIHVDSILKYLKPYQLNKMDNKLELLFLKCEEGVVLESMESAMVYAGIVQLSRLGLCYHDIHPDNVINGYLVDFGLVGDAIPHKLRSEIPMEVRSSGSEIDRFMFNKYYTKKLQTPIRMLSIGVITKFIIMVTILVLGYNLSNLIVGLVSLIMLLISLIIESKNYIFFEGNCLLPKVISINQMVSGLFREKMTLCLTYYRENIYIFKIMIICSYILFRYLNDTQVHFIFFAPIIFVDYIHVMEIITINQEFDKWLIKLLNDIVRIDVPSGVVYILVYGAEMRLCVK